MNHNTNSVSSAINLNDIVHDLCSMLRNNGWRLGTAESCTGGGIAKAITDLSGVSDVFVGGIVAYSNYVKNELLKVNRNTLETYGAVSSETAKEMVRGLIEQLGIQAGIAVTGIAGPGGGTPSKPVGLVYIATYVNGDSISHEYHFTKDRHFVRKQAIQSGLQQLLKHLRDQVDN